ncbi:FimV/HubP family polar landmark protein [Polynucleobacter difficilis]|uniref:FimV/HubP family polar landmark protein n=1 Tax=Polynucleobacter difficilis TaxID=556054 RepID=UPI001F377AA8|nr:FimV/HubP family polar landmark protein [Polynucleobacter difficilis]
MPAPARVLHGLVGVIAGICIAWSATASAISLGTPRVLSQPGQPIRAEIPLRVSVADQEQLSNLQVINGSKADYERLGISAAIVELEPQLRIDRRDGNRNVIVIETAKAMSSAQLNQDPFIDLMVTLQWPSGQLTKNYTLLLGDPNQVTVRPGQTLSEIAAQMAPLLDGATLDQTIMALYKANPDAFAGGSIHRLPAGAELVKPSQSLLQSITPAEASQFVEKANQAWAESHGAPAKAAATKSGDVTKTVNDPAAAKDRLTIGPGADSNSDQRRYTEEIVAQEKILEQTRSRIVELEKNIADLQKLLDAGKALSKPGSVTESNSANTAWAPVLVVFGLIAATGLLLWFMARHARQSERSAPVHADGLASAPLGGEENLESPREDMSVRAKNLFAGIDLNLTPNKNDPAIRNDALRVKLNLAKAYMTIEDFAAAKQSLDDIVQLSLEPSNGVDASLVAEAKAMLSEINQRSS